MATDEAPKYEPKGDFEAYNEPSWVPEGKCKCCAMTNDDVTKQKRRRTPDELRTVEVFAHTLNKNLPVVHCPACDVV